MNYITYKNKNNPHITIHCKRCNQIEKRGGVHTTGRGKYVKHNTYQDAKQYATSTGLPVIHCSFCSPPQCT